MSNSFAISTSGRIATQPKLQYNEDRHARVYFRLAVDDNTRDPASGEWIKRQTVFHDVVAFGKSAERYASALAVGDPVVVAGDLRFSTYDKDGEERTASQVVATAIGPDLRMCDVTIDRSRRGSGPNQSVAAAGPEQESPDQVASPAGVGRGLVYQPENKIKQAPDHQEPPRQVDTGPPLSSGAPHGVATPRWPTRLSRPVSDLPSL